MSCPDTEALLSFIEGRLPESERPAFDAHIEQCSVCRAVILELAPQPPRIADRQTLPSLIESAAEYLEPGTLVGRYAIARRIGQGGMGVVYVARDSQLGRDVALKLVRRGSVERDAAAVEQLKARLVGEAHAMARIAHPNVTAVYDVGWHHEQAFVAMELVRGETLAEWLRGERTQAEILSVFVEAGRGLAAAHTAGLVHRDFKPTNVMIAEHGRVQVMDFGLARTSDLVDELRVDSPAQLSGYVTATGALVGTPAYMAPEQLSGDNVDARTDQFSFCVALYEALAGVRPFAGADTDELRRAIAAGQIQRSKKRIPRQIVGVVERGLRAAREERWPSMDALLNALVRTRARHWRLALVGLVLAVVLGAAAMVMSWRRTPVARRLVTPVQRQLTSSGNVTDEALSPDGKTVVFVAGGSVQLRELASDSTRVVADHAASNVLLWLPDGTGFYYDRLVGDAHQVMRVARTGGAPERVAAFDLTLRAFSPDGKEAILASETAHSLTFTDGAGKRLDKKVALDGDFTWIFGAGWSPSGDRLLAFTKTRDRLEARLATLDGKRQSLLPLDSLVDVSFYDDDTLLWLRHPRSATSGELMLLKLDADRLGPAGESRELLPLWRGGGLSTSRDGRVATYIDDSGAGTDIWAVSIGDNDIPRADKLAFGTTVTCSAAISPDGRSIAVPTFDGKVSDLMVMPFAGGERRHLARMQSCDTPAWSPDSKSLAWRDETQLWILSLDGGAPRSLPLTAPSGDDPALAWPRADRVLYLVEGNHEWRAVDVSSGAITSLTKDTVGWPNDPVPSPDGGQLAVHWMRKGGGVWTVSLDDGSTRPVAVTHWMPQGWSADGKLLYVRPIDSGSVEGSFTLFRVPSTGGTPRQWVTLPFDNRASCSFARDGRHSVCNVPQSHSDLWVIENFGELVAAAH